MSNLTSAIDELRLIELETLTAPELSGLLVELTDHITKLQAERIRVVRSFDKRGIHELDGHTSPTAWLKHRCRLTGSEAAEQVRLGRALVNMPLAAGAFSNGEIGMTAVRLLAAAASAHPATYADHETALVDAAKSLSVRQLSTAVAYWRQAQDFGAASDGADAVFGKRRLHVLATFGGMVRIDGDLDPESGETVLVALEAVTGPDARKNTDGRTPAQRRADALVEICRQYLDQADPSHSGGEKPHVSVLVDLAVLQGTRPGRSETSRGTVLDPDTARRLACDAGISRIIVNGPSEPLDVGRRTRTIPPAIRRALVVRDGGCTHDGCDRPSHWCDAHHLIHWADGGPTSLDNLRLLCRRHHRMAHRSEWEP